MCSDHFENGKYGSRGFSFDDIDQAFTAVGTTNAKSGLIHFYKLKNNEYKFNVKLAIDLTFRYLTSKCPSPPMFKIQGMKEAVYGIACYDILWEYLYNVGEKTSRPDIRIFMSWLDHKTLMRMRAEYLIKHGYMPMDLPLLNTFESNEQQAKSAVMLFMKFERNNNTAVLQRVKNIYGHIKLAETEALYKVIGYLEAWLEQSGRTDGRPYAEKDRIFN
jgi:hypothetical protein